MKLVLVCALFLCVLSVSIQDRLEATTAEAYGSKGYVKNPNNYNCRGKDCDNKNGYCVYVLKGAYSCDCAKSKVTADLNSCQQV